jgi:hypothetical protein
MMVAYVVSAALLISTSLGLFGLAFIVAPVAKATLLVVPVIFTISLAVGFASKRRTWFH